MMLDRVEIAPSDNQGPNEGTWFSFHAVDEKCKVADAERRRIATAEQAG